MKHLFSLLLLVISNAAFSQPSSSKRLDDNSVVVDSSGMRYNPLIWKKLLSSGDYTI